MQTINAWLTLARSWADYLLYCSFQPMQQPICRPFWYWVMVASVVAGSVVIAAVAWKVIGDVRRMRRLRRMMAEREAKTAEEIEKARWKGDEVYSGDEPPEQMQEQIRRAIDERRLTASTPAPPNRG